MDITMDIAWIPQPGTLVCALCASLRSNFQRMSTEGGAQVMGNPTSEIFCEVKQSTRAVQSEV